MICSHYFARKFSLEAYGEFGGPEEVPFVFGQASKTYSSFQLVVFSSFFCSFSFLLYLF